MQSGALQAIRTRTIPNSGQMRYPGVFDTERVFPATPVVLKEVLYTERYSIIKPLLVTSDIGNILGEKGLLFAEGGGYKMQRKLVLPAFSHARVKGPALEFWARGVEMNEKVAEWRQCWWRCGGVGGGGGEVVLGDAGDDQLFRLNYKFRVLESASIGSSRNAEENSGSGLADAHTAIFNISSPSRTVATLSIIFPSRSLQSLPLKPTPDVDYKSCDRVNYCG